MERYRRPETLSSQQQYLQTLIFVKNAYEETGLRPLFVGGVIAKTLNLGTIQQVGIDYATCMIHIPTTVAEFTGLRSDGTADDFDVIVNHPDKDHVDSTVRYVTTRLKELGLTKHFVSTEAVRYPNWRPRNQVLQMVSGMDIDDNGEIRFTYGETKSPPVPCSTMKSWTYALNENGKRIISLPSFGPALFGLRYLMRLPISGHGGLRQKDRMPSTDKETGRHTNKIHTLMTLRKKAIIKGKEQGYDLNDEAWREFIVRLQHKSYQDPLTRQKSKLFHFYWDTLGSFATAIAHGKGIFEEAAKLGNKFTG